MIYQGSLGFLKSFFHILNLDRGRHNRSAQASKKNKDNKKGTEKEDEQKNIKKIYRLKYEKYLRVKTTTNSPFDLLVAATQVINQNFCTQLIFLYLYFLSFSNIILMKIILIGNKC